MCDLEDQRHFIQLRRKGEAGQVPDLKVDPFKERTKILDHFKERTSRENPNMLLSQLRIVENSREHYQDFLYQHQLTELFPEFQSQSHGEE